MADNSNNTNYSDQSEDRKSRLPQDNKLHEAAKKKRKFRSIFVAILTISLVLSIGAGIVYANRYTIINSFANMTKSPAEYYSFIEKNNRSAIIKSLASQEDNTMVENRKKYAYDVTTDVSINHEAVDSLLKSYLGTGLTDLEALIGIPLESIGAEAVVGLDKEFINETFSLSMNNVKLITTELFMNTATNEAILNLPELSPAYLRLTDGETVASDSSILDHLTPQRTAAMMERYSDIMIDNIHQVTFGENKLLTIDNLSEECMSLNITLTPDDLYNIEMSVLANVRTEEFILDLLPVYNITEEQYQSYLDGVQTELENSKDTLKALMMVVYVDSKGRILRRTIFTEDSVATLGYTILFDKTDIEYNVYLTDDTGSSVFVVQGTQTTAHGSSDGKISGSINTYEGDSPYVSFDVTYEDLHTEKKGDRTFLYGNITLSSLEMMGMQIIMDFDAPSDSQTCRIVFQMGAASLITINSEIKYLENYIVTVPPENAEIYDTSQAKSYIATFHLDDYIANLSEQFGLDLQGTLDYYLPDVTN